MDCYGLYEKRGKLFRGIKLYEYYSLYLEIQDVQEMLEKAYPKHKYVITKSEDYENVWGVDKIVFKRFKSLKYVIMKTEMKDGK